MNLLFPLGMAALGALAPLIVLYLLKRKREDTPIPAAFLWAVALEDLRASSLFQRLRTPLLLFLQALAVILFALAAAGASLDLDLGGEPRHVVVLLDRSRSMQATDGDPDSEGDPVTRFEAAKELVSDAIEGLRHGDEMMIIAFDATSEIVSSFTPDQDRLLERLETLEARDTPTHARQAFEMAVSFAQASVGFRTEVIVVSDGRVAEELGAIPFPVTYAKVGSSGANQGIASTHLAAELGAPGQLFVRVVNASSEAVTRTVVLSRGGQVMDARTADLPRNGDLTVFFEVPEPEGDAPEVLTVGLDGSDVLPADDKVELISRPVVPRSGLIVQNEPSLYLDPDKIEELHPGLALTPLSPTEAEELLSTGQIRVDFILYDGVAPGVLPDVAAQLYVGCLPPSSGLKAMGKLDYPIIIDWERTHPATNRLSFDDVVVLEGIKLSGHERSAALVESTGGPLVLLTPVPGREVVVVAFSPEKSNLPLKLAWPLFLANTLDFLLSGVEREGEEALVSVGTPFEITGEGDLKVRTPSGSDEVALADDRGRARFADTYRSGVYQLSNETGRSEPRAVALQDGTEIAIAPAEDLRLGTDAVKSNPAALSRNVLLRDPLLILALALLVLEWAVWCGRR